MTLAETLHQVLKPYVDDRPGTMAPGLRLKSAIADVMETIERHHFVIPKHQHSQGMAQVKEGLDMLT